MTNVIGPFRGEWRWLSNFWPARVYLDGVEYPTVEHAYVAAKTLDLELRAAVLAFSSPGDAKRLGRKFTLRPDWDSVKLDVMESLLRQKFADPMLRRKLVWTYPNELVELNEWGDTFWGVCRGKGENHLGRILMKIRDEARQSA
jgi:hypothetical protein